MPTLAASADTAAIAVGPSPMPPHSGGMCGSQRPHSSGLRRAARRSSCDHSSRSPGRRLLLGRAHDLVHEGAHLQADLVDLGREREVDHGAESGHAEPGRLAGDIGRSRVARRRRAPAGRGEGRGRPGDVRHHRAPLRPRQPDHDVPPRRAAGDAGPSRRSACPSGATVLDLAVRHRRPVHRAAAGAASARCPSTCRSACSPPTAAARPGCRPTSCRLPVAAGGGRRRHVRLRAAQPRRPRRRSSTSWPASCAPAAASRCSRWPHRPTRCCAAGHGIYFGQVVPVIGGAPVRPGRLPLPAPQRGLPARRRTRCWPGCGGAGFTDVAPATAVGRHHPARRRRPACVKAGHPPARAGPSTSIAFAGGDGCLFVPRRRRPGRARRGAPGCRRPRPPDVLADDRASTTRSAGRAPGRWPSARCRSCPAAPASWSCPPSSSAATPTARRGSTRDRRRRRRPRRRPPTAAGAAAAASRCGPASTPAEFQAAVVQRPRRGARPGGSTKVVLARDVVDRGRRSRIDVHAILRRACGRRSARATATRSTASSAPAPSCSWPATATSCAPTRWPAPRRARGDPAIDARLAAAADRLDQGPGRAPGHDRDGARHAAAVVLATSTGRPSRPSSPWPTCSTSAPPSRAGCRSPPPSVLELVARAAADAGPRRPSPAPRPWPLIAELEAVRPRPLRRAGRLGRRRGQRRVGGRHPLRRDRRPHGPAVRRRRRGGRLRPRRRAGRDPGQVPGDAVGHRPAVSNWRRARRDLLRCRVPVVLHRQAPLRGGAERVRATRDEIEVVWRPFQLDPRAPRRRRRSLDAYARKFGGPEQAAQIIDHMTAIGRRRRARLPPRHRPAGQHLRRPPAAVAVATPTGSRAP